MTITLQLDNNEEMAVRELARQYHIEPREVTKRLKNIYHANLNDDLVWIGEIITEDNL